MNMIYVKMGERISMVRIYRGLSREELAEQAGISSKFLYEIENGKKGFSALTLYEICTALDVPSEYLMTGEIWTLANHSAGMPRRR